MSAKMPQAVVVKQFAGTRESHETINRLADVGFGDVGSGNQAGGASGTGPGEPAAPS